MLALKIVPLLVMMSGLYAGQENYDDILFYVEDAAVKNELRGITKLIYLDYITTDELPTTASFPTYLKENMRVDESINRDLSKDRWGSSYTYKYFVENNKAYVRVSSAGRDKNFNTDDDLYSQIVL